MVDTHATQVAGTFIGNGVASEDEGGAPFQWAGVAPEAFLFAYQRSPTDVVGDEISQSYADNATVVTNHSYGLTVNGEEDCASVGTYGAHSQSIDGATVLNPVTSALAAGPTIFPNSACTTALIDRIVHHSDVIVIEGDSYRRREAQNKTRSRRSKRDPIED